MEVNGGCCTHRKGRRIASECRASSPSCWSWVKMEDKVSWICPACARRTTFAAGSDLERASSSTENSTTLSKASLVWTQRRSSQSSRTPIANPASPPSIP